MVAALDDSEARHVEARRALDSDQGPFVLSPFVLQEVDYLISKRLGVDVELAFLAEVAEGRYRLEPFGHEDTALAAEVIYRYRDLGIGLADASIVVLAARHATDRLLSFDERHFRAIRPLQGRAFRLLPADA